MNDDANQRGNENANPSRTRVSHAHAGPTGEYDRFLELARAVVTVSKEDLDVERKKAATA